MAIHSFHSDRRSVRLRDFDYGQSGAYFVTIVAHWRTLVCGEVSDGGMVLSAAGLIVQATWEGLPCHYPGLALDAFVVMPNHVHALVVLEGEPGGRAGRRAGFKPAPTGNGYRRAGFRPAPTGDAQPRAGLRPAPTVHGLFEVVRALKAFSARGINSLLGTAGSPVWQRGYYEHVIRNDVELDRARRYIVENPLRWELDEENPGRRGP